MMYQQQFGVVKRAGDAPPNSVISSEQKQSKLSLSILPQKSQMQSLSPKEQHQLLSSSVLMDQTIDIEKVGLDPFAFINDSTTRDTLFKIIYVLQEHNNKVLTQIMPTLQGSRIMLDTSRQEKKKLLDSLRDKNAQCQVQKELLDFYINQKKQLKRQIAYKQHEIKRMKQELQHNLFLNASLQEQNQLNEERLGSLREQKMKVLDQIKKKKGSQKMADSGTIDRLLREYYETIKEVMDEDSVDRINRTTKAALSELAKKQVGDGFFAAFMDGLETRKAKPQ